MATPRVGRRLPLAGALLGLLVCALVVAASGEAARAVGTPFPSLMVDPSGRFSSVWLPSWGDAAAGLRFPDRLVAVDGAPVGDAIRYGDFPADRLEAAVRARLERGSARVSLEFDRDGRRATVEVPIRRIGRAEVAVLFLFYALLGAFVLSSGATALALARSNPAAVAFAAWAGGTFVFLVTFFDYHTTRALTPLFFLSVIWIELSCLWLAYAFPEPLPWARARVRAALRAATAVGVAAGGWIAVAPLVGVDAHVTRIVASRLSPVPILLLALCVALRHRASEGRAREELRATLWGMVSVPLLVGLGYAALHEWGVALIHLLLPFLAALMPVSLGYALVRHNILATPALLTRRLLMLPIGMGALLGGAGIWFGWELLAEHRWLLVALRWGTSAGGTVGLFLLGDRLASRALFRARAHFRPSVQHLSDKLGTSRDAAALRQSVREAVADWLPTSGVEVIGVDELPRVPRAPAGAAARLGGGDLVWTEEDPRERRLLVPMRTLEALRGVLVVSPMRPAGLYTDEDVELLETIASLGALALHNLQMISELDALRRDQLDVARSDKRLTIDLLSAEICHEISYPLSFFRHLLSQAPAGGAMSADAVEIGREEVARLQRMLTRLRRFSIGATRLGPVRLAAPLDRALTLLQESLLAKRIAFERRLDEALEVDAEFDGLVQLFANLLRNAVQAAPDGGRVGVRCGAGPAGLGIVVWDDGPGVPPETAANLFKPWVTTREEGLGLGLVITQRIATGFGWTIRHEREDGLTCFRIDVPGWAARSAPPGRKGRDA